jgi:hypothetical protein
MKILIMYYLYNKKRLRIKINDRNYKCNTFKYFHKSNNVLIKWIYKLIKINGKK